MWIWLIHAVFCQNRPIRNGLLLFTVQLAQKDKSLRQSSGRVQDQDSYQGSKRGGVT